MVVEKVDTAMKQFEDVCITLHAVMLLVASTF